MTVSPLGMLGLGEVTADPNDGIPDGKYRGQITDSRIVTSKDDKKLMHVTTYTVSEGEHKGVQRADFQQLGTDPVKDADGNITSFTNTMTEQNKQWYKKRLVTDLGVPEEAVDNGTFDVANLKGKNVVFGIKRNNGYINVSFVELTEGAAPAATPTDAAGLL